MGIHTFQTSRYLTQLELNSSSSPWWEGCPFTQHLHSFSACLLTHSPIIPFPQKKSFLMSLFDGLLLVSTCPCPDRVDSLEACFVTCQGLFFLSVCTTCFQRNPLLPKQSQVSDNKVYRTPKDQEQCRTGSTAHPESWGGKRPPRCKWDSSAWQFISLPFKHD